MESSKDVASCSNINSYQKQISLDIRSHKPARKQRRSYNCGPCKKQKIKCDMLIPCGACTRYKRLDKCLAEPPNPPSSIEMAKKIKKKNNSVDDGAIHSSSIISNINYHSLDYESGNVYGNVPSQALLSANRPQSQILLPIPNSVNQPHSHMSRPNIHHHLHSRSNSFLNNNQNHFVNQNPELKLSPPPLKFHSNSQSASHLVPHQPNRLNSMFPSLRQRDSGAPNWDQFSSPGNIPISSRHNSAHNLFFNPIGSNNNTGQLLPTGSLFSGLPHSNPQSGKSSDSESGSTSPLDESKRPIISQKNGFYSNSNAAQHKDNTVDDLKASLLHLQKRIVDFEKTSSESNINHHGELVSLPFNSEILNVFNSLPKRINIHDNNVSIQFSMSDAISQSMNSSASTKYLERRLLFQVILNYLPSSIDFIKSMIEFEDKIKTIIEIPCPSKESLMNSFEKFWSSKHLVSDSNIDFTMISDIFLRLSRGILQISKKYMPDDEVKLNNDSIWFDFNKLSRLWFDIYANCCNFTVDKFSNSATKMNQYAEIEVFLEEIFHLQMLSDYESIYQKLGKIIACSYMLNLHINSHNDQFEQNEISWRNHLWKQVRILDFETSSKLGTPVMINSAVYDISDITLSTGSFLIIEECKLKVIQCFQKANFQYYQANNIDQNMDSIEKILKVINIELDGIVSPLKLRDNFSNSREVVQKYIINTEISIHKIRLNSLLFNSSPLSKLIYSTTIANSLNYYNIIRRELSESALFESYFLILELNIELAIRILVHLIFHNNYAGSILKAGLRTLDSKLEADVELLIKDLNYLKMNHYCSDIPMLSDGLKLIHTLKDIQDHMKMTTSKPDFNILSGSINKIDPSLLKALVNSMGGETYFKNVIMSLWIEDDNNVITEKILVTSDLLISNQSLLSGYSPTGEIINDHLVSLSQRVIPNAAANRSASISSGFPLNDLEWSNIDDYKNSVAKTTTLSGESEFKPVAKRGTGLAELVLNGGSQYNYRYN